MPNLNGNGGLDLGNRPSMASLLQSLRPRNEKMTREKREGDGEISKG